MSALQQCHRYLSNLSQDTAEAASVMTHRANFQTTLLRIRSSSSGRATNVTTKLLAHTLRLQKCALLRCDIWPCTSPSWLLTAWLLSLQRATSLEEADGYTALPPSRVVLCLLQRGSSLQGPQHGRENKAGCSQCHHSSYQCALLCCDI